MNKAELAEMSMYRGLGYGQKEIGEKMGKSQSTVHKHLKKLRWRAKEEGPERVFFELLLYGPIDSDSLRAGGNTRFERKAGEHWGQKEQAEFLRHKK
tara:strand:+ start:1787 stop:2077 length:291 start_codon:yes stop_codon:yes gene_type:complete